MRLLPARLRSRLSDDTGAISMLVVMLVTMAILFTALLVDSGSIRNARRASADAAQQAARAGAQEVDRAEFLANEEIILDADEARQAAQAVLGAEGVTGTISIGDKTVTVTVTKPVSTMLIGGRTVTSTRSADAYEGT